MILLHIVAERRCIKLSAFFLDHSVVNHSLSLSEVGMRSLCLLSFRSLMLVFRNKAQVI